jgi:hypothetical protein
MSGNAGRRARRAAVRDVRKQLRKTKTRQQQGKTLTFVVFKDIGRGGAIEHDGELPTVEQVDELIKRMVGAGAIAEDSPYALIAMQAEGSVQ